MNLSGRLKLSVLRRHLRRARARWRLHRMEWNALYTPMDPPKGYEHYHTAKAVFPGLAGDSGYKSRQHFWECVRGGFKLYMHHYFPNPEMTELERRWAEKREKVEDERIEKFASRAAETAQEGKKKVAAAAAEAAEKLEEARPAAKAFFADRVKVFQEAVVEFSAGFQETLSGEKNIWGQTPGSDDDDDELEDNRRVIYIVDEKPEEK